MFISSESTTRAIRSWERRMNISLYRFTEDLPPSGSSLLNTFLPTLSRCSSISIELLIWYMGVVYLRYKKPEVRVIAIDKANQYQLLSTLPSKRFISKDELNCLSSLSENCGWLACIDLVCNSLVLFTYQYDTVYSQCRRHQCSDGRQVEPQELVRLLAAYAAWFYIYYIVLFQIIIRAAEHIPAVQVQPGKLSSSFCFADDEDIVLSSGYWYISRQRQCVYHAYLVVRGYDRSRLAHFSYYGYPVVDDACLYYRVFYQLLQSRAQQLFYLAQG